MLGKVDGNALRVGGGEGWVDGRALPLGSVLGKVDGNALRLGGGMDWLD